MKDSATVSAGRVEAVERALAILKAFRLAGEELSLAELTRRTGYYKSTTLRLAASLIHDGFLLRNPSGTYMLGPELPRLAALCMTAPDLEGVIRPYLKSLVDLTQESASFFVRSGNERVCRYRENSPLAIRHHLDEGQVIPLDRGASGHILLAFGSERENSKYDELRAQGFYRSLGERDPDVVALSVPVFDAVGRLWGALAVSGLHGRFSDERQADALAALRTISEELGRKLPVVGAAVL